MLVQTDEPLPKHLLSLCLDTRYVREHNVPGGFTEIDSLGLKSQQGCSNILQVLYEEAAVREYSKDEGKMFASRCMAT